MKTGAELFSHYRSKGFSFPPDILSRYALSLSAKPFVILSGISGTGKTKIAQLFPIEEINTNSRKEVTVSAANPEKISVTVTAGLRDTDGRGNINAKFMSVVFESDELALIEKRIEQLKAANRDDNIREPKSIEIIAPSGSVMKWSVYVQRANSPLIRLRSKSKRSEVPSYDWQPFLQRHYDKNDIITLEKVGPYKFRIVDSANEDIAVAKYLPPEIDNQLFVSVRSDWTDQSEVFGYFDSISEKYLVSPILKFLLTAHDHPFTPFHLILDEMNLSKVESYFSDFLSCLESRILEPGGDFKQEPIRLHNYGDFVDASDINVEQVPREFELPRNLYVTGTVNVDETTYMFSPKVLDRANVIEFNDVDLLRIGGTTSGGAISLDSLPDFSEHVPINQMDFDNLAEDLKDVVVKIHTELKSLNKHFGYRTAFEMARFLNISGNCVGTSGDQKFAAMDAQVVQKVLPKIHGSQAEVEPLILKLFATLLNYNVKLVDESEISNEWLKETAPDLILDSDFNLSLTKLSHMLLEVRQKGFTAFIN